MIQEIIVFLLFAGAIAYIGRLFYKSVMVKNRGEGACINCPENPAGDDKTLKK